MKWLSRFLFILPEWLTQKQQQLGRGFLAAKQHARRYFFLSQHQHLSFLCRYHKLSLTWWLQTMQAYYAIVLEVESKIVLTEPKSKCHLAWDPSAYPRGESVSLPFPAFPRCPHSCLQSQQQSVFSSASASVFTSPSLVSDSPVSNLIRILWLHWAHADHLNILNIMTSQNPLL